MRRVTTDSAVDGPERLRGRPGAAGRGLARSRGAINVLMLGPDTRVRGGIASVEHVILEHVPDHGCLSIRHVATYREGSVLRRVTIFALAFLQTAVRLVVDRVDVVHVHFASRGSTWRKLMLAMLARCAGKPVVLHAHGGGFHEFLGRLPRSLRLVIAWTVRQCTLLVVLSESWRGFYGAKLGLSNSRIVALPNPVTFPSTVPRRENSLEVTLVFLGRICREKGIPDLLRAIARLPDVLRERTRLVAAGDGDIESSKRLAAELGVGDRVEFPGWLAGHERDRLLARGDVFVLPSYAEGLPMALLEAMAWGLPVIATTVGGIPEIVRHGENGLLVRPGDVEGLQVVISEMVKDSAFRTALGASARSSVEPLSASRYMSTLIDIYTAAIRMHGRHTRP